MSGGAGGFGRVEASALEARDWGWRYATRKAWAVDRVSLRIEPGERVLLLGASGSGKSTLLHGLAGLLGGADEGEHRGDLLVDGSPADAARGRVGLVLQDPDTQAVLARVGDDVAFGCENLGVDREQIWPRVRAALDAVGLEVSLDRSTSALSGGQKQRLALAGVLAMRPGAILLDEPTANLDPEGVREVRDAVRRALDATGATLVVVEHRLDVWLPLVDRVIVLGAGEGTDVAPAASMDASPPTDAAPGSMDAAAGPGTDLRAAHPGRGSAAGILADGLPGEVLGSRGSDLARTGVWVPGIPPAFPAPPTRAAGDVLLTGRDLVVARGSTPVAGPLDIDVRAGEVLGITGPNGAGKSTLGLVLAGLQDPQAGRVEASAALSAGARGTEPARWRSRELLTRIGTVFQDPEHQLLAATVRAELEIGPRALGLSDDERAARVDELLVRLRLDRLAEANPYTLSGGEKRRLTVAAMLATRPRVMVLDEPTFGQDARTWAELVAIIAGLRDEGAAVVAISHDDDVLRALHARRFALRGGGT